MRRRNDPLIPLNDHSTIAPDTVNRTGNSPLIVLADHRLVGIVALKDILKFLSLKLDLEGTRYPETPPSANRRHLLNDCSPDLLRILLPSNLRVFLNFCH
ncbi:hypothetical protein ACTRXD_11420 [Nitrospira sp. T9]|uniref:hypothetical protein n=1 Tax=unclassified Nitrospira TaxID=2652172 RepID=UPI003F962D63